MIVMQHSILARFFSQTCAPVLRSCGFGFCSRSRTRGIALCLIALAGQRYAVNQHATGAADDDAAAVLRAGESIAFPGSRETADDHIRASGLNWAVVVEEQRVKQPKGMAGEDLLRINTPNDNAGLYKAASALTIKISGGHAVRLVQHGGLA